MFEHQIALSSQGSDKVESVSIERAAELTFQSEARLLFYQIIEVFKERSVIR